MLLLTILLLLHKVTAAADKQSHQTAIYNKYYTHVGLPTPYRIFNTSSLLKCAATCVTYAEEPCRGYHFFGNSCQLYRSHLQYQPLSSNQDPETVTSVIWTDRSRYLGCWEDKAYEQRDLTFMTHIMGELATIAQCIEICYGGGYAFAGLQYFEECRCGNSYGSHDKRKESECNTPCYGDTTTMCGGSLRNTIFRV